MSWQSMETAPKDGTKFIGFDGARPFLCYWQQYYVKYPHEEGGPTYRGQWTGDYYDCITPETAIGWMPMPRHSQSKGGS